MPTGMPRDRARLAVPDRLRVALEVDVVRDEADDPARLLDVADRVSGVLAFGSVRKFVIRLKSALAFCPFCRTTSRLSHSGAWAPATP